LTTSSPFYRPVFGVELTVPLKLAFLFCIFSWLVPLAPPPFSGVFYPVLSVFRIVSLGEGLLRPSVFHRVMRCSAPLVHVRRWGLVRGVAVDPPFSCFFRSFVCCFFLWCWIWVFLTSGVPFYNLKVVSFARVCVFSSSVGTISPQICFAEPLSFFPVSFFCRLPRRLDLPPPRFRPGRRRTLIF